MSFTDKNVLFNANLKEILNDYIEQINSGAGTQILGNPTVAIGTSSAAKVKTSAFDVIRNGVTYTIDAAETAFTATVDDIAEGYGAVYNIYLDEDNDIKILKGTATLLGTNAACPATPEGGLKIGEVKVVTTALFDASTTLLSAETVTDTYSSKTDALVTVDDYEPKHWLHWHNLHEILEDINDVVVDDGGYRLLSNPTLAIGTSSKAKVKHNAFDVMVDGVISNIATGEVAFTATTDDLVDGTGAVYLVYLDGTTVKILKGTATSGGTGAVCPATPAGKLKLGEVKLVTDGAAFDATTTDLDALTVTDTYTNKTDAKTDFALSYSQSHYLFNKNLLDVFEWLLDGLEFANNNRVLGDPNLAFGTDEEKVKNDAFFLIQDGVVSTIASTETAFTATDHDIADGKEATFLVYVDGTTIKLSKSADAAVGASVCPATPAGKVKIGEVIISADGAIFNATTDELDVAVATHLDVEFVNKVDTLDAIV